MCLADQHQQLLIAIDEVEEEEKGPHGIEGRKKHWSSVILLEFIKIIVLLLVAVMTACFTLPIEKVCSPFAVIAYHSRMPLHFNSKASAGAVEDDAHAKAMFQNSI
ncbi:hypothetical protein GmHk_05G012066 [Glycine max]|nr:hypothetical protein GmHk_05G012066 [Glycine max]